LAVVGRTYAIELIDEFVTFFLDVARLDIVPERGVAMETP
jgi:hypothetical protein